MSKHRNRVGHLGRKADAVTRQATDEEVAVALEPLRLALAQRLSPRFPNPWTPEYAVVVRAERFDATRLRLTVQARSGQGGTASWVTTGEQDSESYAAGLRLLHGEPPESVPDVYDPERDAWKAACDRAADEAHEAWLLRVNDLLHRLPQWIAPERVLQVVEAIR